MDRKTFQEITRLFNACLDLDESERSGFLKDECKENKLLFNEVMGLLAHDASSEIPELLTDADHLTDPTKFPLKTYIDSVLEQNPIPDHIGPFKIIKELGRGGMGIVYEAQQRSPNRRVAIKVVNGLASSEHRKRLRREAQALALIEDPGVARIYSSGVDEVFGIRTPYIVMELVDGLHVDQWVREHNLSTNDRLQIITRIADAVQIAHSKGVIHRDLKLSNIVVLADSNSPGQPKVLDFGIARLLDQQETIASTKQHTNNPVGTLQYMSPEQFDPDPALIDARSDIYALGIVAYTVLSGREPFDAESLSLSNAASIITNQSPIPLGGIDAALKGDVSTVVAKAMEKNPSRRYQTMEAFAADLRRVLDKKPILARPPSPAYLLSKFIDRNRVLSGSIVIIASIIIYSIFTIGEQRGKTLLESQTTQAVSSFIIDMLQSIEPDTAKGDEVTIRAVLDNATQRIDLGELESQPEIQARLRVVIARVYYSLGEYQNAHEQVNAAIDTLTTTHTSISVPVAEAVELRAQIETRAGLYAQAEQSFEIAASTYERLGEPKLILSPDGSLGHVYFWTNRLHESEAFFRAALQELDGVDPATDARIGHALSSLASTLESLGDLDAALEMHSQGIQAYKLYYGEHHSKYAEALNDYGNTLAANNGLDIANQVLRESLEIREKLFRDDHPDIAVSLNNLSIVLIRLGNPSDAIPMLIRARDIRMASLGPNHPSTASVYGNLARAYMEAEQLEIALNAFDEALSITQSAVGENHPMHIVFSANRGICLARLSRYDDAENILLEQYKHATELLGESHFRTQKIADQILEHHELRDNHSQSNNSVLP